MCPFVLWWGLPCPFVKPLVIPFIGEWLPEAWWFEWMPLRRWRGEPWARGEAEKGFLAGLEVPLVRTGSSLFLLSKLELFAVLGLLESLLSGCELDTVSPFSEEVLLLFLLVGLDIKWWDHRGLLAVGSRVSSFVLFVPCGSAGESGWLEVGEWLLSLLGEVNWGFCLRKKKNHCYLCVISMHILHLYINNHKKAKNSTTSSSN